MINRKSRYDTMYAITLLIEKVPEIENPDNLRLSTASELAGILSCLPYLTLHYPPLSLACLMKIFRLGVRKVGSLSLVNTR